MQVLVLFTTIVLRIYVVRLAYVSSAVLPMQNIKSKKTLSVKNRQDFKTVYISSYVPRKCGIATFANDLTQAIDKLRVGETSEIIAMNDAGQKYDYPSEVKLQINQFNKDDYERAAKYINKSSADIVSLQHEFGLYGGPEGSFSCCLSAGSKTGIRSNNAEIESRYYLLSMLDNINKPIVTTFHTILLNPDSQQSYIMRRIIKSSSAVVAMTESSRLALIKIYKCPAKKVSVIYHGVPDFKLGKTAEYKQKLHINDADPMILVAGLLGPGKGIEHVINAMPNILKTAPNAKLFVVGQTHPVILKNDGDGYREKLIKLIQRKNLTNNVEFVNRYLSDEDLYDYFQASDFFVTAYSNMQQSASGTLAWAVGAGKICISTPYQYAKELLSDDDGILIESGSSVSIAKNIIDMFNNPDKKELMSKKAYNRGHQYIWSNVAADYVELFKKCIKTVQL